MDASAFSYNISSRGDTKSSKLGFIKTVDKINEICQHQVELDDAEIESLVGQVGNYFLEYSVDGESRNYGGHERFSQQPSQ